MNLKGSFARGAMGTAIGLILVLVLISQINFDHFFEIGKKISIAWILFAFALYTLSTILRAYRWKKMIFAKSVSLPSFFCVTSIHNFLNQLLPARTGEISYVVLLQKTQSVPVSQGVATLLLARVIDVMAMGFFFMISIFLFWNKTAVSSFNLFLITFLTMPILMIVFVALFSRKGIEIMIFIFSKLGLMRWKISSVIADFLTRLGQDLYQIRISGRLLIYFFLTLAIWGVKFFSFYAICQNLLFQRPVTFGEVVLGTTFSELASTLPFYGIGGFGTIEGAWALGFLLLGYPKQQVILNAFCFHILLLSFSAVLGSLGFFMLRAKRKNSSPMAS